MSEEIFWSLYCHKINIFFVTFSKNDRNKQTGSLYLFLIKGTYPKTSAELNKLKKKNLLLTEYSY